jgi:hypothetical protein
VADQTPTQPPPPSIPKLGRFGIWVASSNASSGSAICRVSGESDGRRLTITADIRNQSSIQLILDGEGLEWPTGTQVGVSMKFPSGQPQHLIGYSDGASLNFDLTRANLAPWFHEFTARSSMSVNFDVGSPMSRTFDLRGTTPAVNAMSDCTRFYGFYSLPPPFLPTTVSP